MFGLDMFGRWICLVLDMFGFGYVQFWICSFGIRICLVSLDMFGYVWFWICSVSDKFLFFQICFCFRYVQFWICSVLDMICFGYVRFWIRSVLNMFGFGGTSTRGIIPLGLVPEQ